MMFDAGVVISPGTAFLRVIAGFLAGLVVGMIVMRRTVKKLTTPQDSTDEVESHATAGSHS